MKIARSENTEGKNLNVKSKSNFQHQISPQREKRQQRSLGICDKTCQ